MLKILCRGLLAVLPLAAATFVDPSTELINPTNIVLADSVFIAPFATLRAGATSANAIVIESASNIQEHVTIDATRGKVEIGSYVEVGHGATLLSGVKVAKTGVCPPSPSFCGTFIGFQAEIAEGAVVEKDTLVFGFARLGPGVTLPSGRKTFAGVNIQTNAQALDPAFTAPMTEADRLFIQAVVFFNSVHAAGYPALAAPDPTNVYGINWDHGFLNPGPSLPTLAGVLTRLPSFRNRIIGDVRLADNLRRLDKVMGSKISLRADEGKPLVIGEIKEMGSGVLIHTFLGTELELGGDGSYGHRSIVHSSPLLSPTKTGKRFNLASESVLFQAQAGDNVSIGHRSFVLLSVLPNGTSIPSRKIVVDNTIVGDVQW